MTDEEKRQKKAEEEAARKAAEEEAARKAAEAEGEGDDKKPKVIQMTEEEMNAFADKMYARGAKNSKDAKEAKKLQEELEELRKFKEEQDKKAKRGDQSDEEAAMQKKLDELTQEYEKKFDELRGKAETEAQAREADRKNFQLEKLKSQVLSAASAAGAHDPEDVFVLMQNKGFFKQDEETGSWMILNPDTGKIRIDVEAKGEPLSLKKGVGEFVDERPHMKRPSGRQGSGSGGGSNGSDREVPTPQGLDVDNLKPSELFQRRKEILDYVRAGGKASVGGRHNQG